MIRGVHALQVMSLKVILQMENTPYELIHFDVVLERLSPTYFCIMGVKGLTLVHKLN